MYPLLCKHRFHEIFKILFSFSSFTQQTVVVIPAFFLFLYRSLARSILCDLERHTQFNFTTHLDARPRSDGHWPTKLGKSITIIIYALLSLALSLWTGQTVVINTGTQMKYFLITAAAAAADDNDDPLNNTTDQILQLTQIDLRSDSTFLRNQ